jgi:WhiB family redox-sensing transcriptional regulator
MERYNMSQITTVDGTSFRLLPIVMSGPAAPFPGGWQALALCTAEDPGLFFPAHNDPGTRARKVCARCPVLADCLDYATAADELGIWGGLDQQQRQNRKRRQRHRQAAHAEAEGAA